MKTSKKLSAKTKVNETDDPLAGDLSGLMLEADWKMARFELTKPKNKAITLRISDALLKQLKKQAKDLGLDYQKFIRITLENSIRRRAS